MPLALVVGNDARHRQIGRTRRDVIKHLHLQINLGNVLDGVRNLQDKARPACRRDSEGVVLLGGKARGTAFDAKTLAGEIDGLIIRHIYIRCRESALHCTRTRGRLKCHLN